MDFVGVDIGASNTRYVTNKGNVYTVPNNMVLLDWNGGSKLSEVRLEPHGDNPEDALELTVEHRVEGLKVASYHCLYGDFAKRYSGRNQTPSSLKAKTEQEINIISVVMAAALGVIKDGLGENLGLYIALPPSEVKSRMHEVIKMFGGEWDINFVKLNKKLKLTFNPIMCYEESFLAALDYFFDMNGKLRKNASKYTTGNVLSLDIGASTSDLVIVQDMKYLEHTGQTVKIGGNVARQYMQNWVSQTYGFDAPDETLERAIAEGRLQMGNGYVECSEAVCSAKKELARDIVNHITNYFRAVNIPIQMLRAIVVSGGGSMPGSYVDEGGNTMSTSPSVTKYITEYLLDVCPDVEVEQMERNPRMSNIHGLFVRAKLDTVVGKAANGSGCNSKVKGNNSKAASKAASKDSDSAEDGADSE